MIACKNCPLELGDQEPFGGCAVLCGTRYLEDPNFPAQLQAEEDEWDEYWDDMYDDVIPEE